MGVIESTLLILAALGWLTSVTGALLVHKGSAKLSKDDDRGTFRISTSESHSRWGVTLVVIGASAGAAGTILAVIATE